MRKRKTAANLKLSKPPIVNDYQGNYERIKAGFAGKLDKYTIIE